MIIHSKILSIILKMVNEEKKNNFKLNIEETKSIITSTIKLKDKFVKL